MSLISGANLAFQFPSTGVLFDNLSFSINPGDRIAIVGPNGSGKTTLLQLLEGVLEPTSGALSRRGGLVFATSAQQLESEPGRCLLDFVLETRPVLSALRRRLAELESSSAVADPIEYATALHEYMEAGGYEVEAVAHKVLDGLGFAEHEFGLELAELSGGQRRRASLARALHCEAGVLLLDEPTNHLDLDGRRWLAVELATRPQACVFVSHDRALLRACATRVIHLDRKTATVFDCGYDAWRAAMELRKRQAWADFEGAQRRKTAAENAAAKRSQLALRVAAPPPGVRLSRDFYARKAAKVNRTARILRERAAVEAEVSKPWEEQPIPQLTFDNAARPAAFPIVARGLSKGFGEKTLFSGLDLQVPRDARLAITGPNGCGKTTLLRILAGLEPPDIGEVHLAAGTRLGCLMQDASHLAAVLTPLEICGASTLARTLMGCLKLRPDRVNRPLDELSPGERAKVALVQMLSGGANLLLLDEPTEHLEIEAQEALEQALASFRGAVVVISHDAAFLESLGAEVPNDRRTGLVVGSV